jgi:hypothetical protein
LKILKVKHKDLFYEVILDEEDYLKFSKEKIRINVSRGKPFAVFYPNSSCANSIYLHKLILKIKETRVNFIDNNTLNLQKSNILVLTKETVLEKRKNYYIKKRQEISSKNKEKWELIKNNPEKYKKRLEYIHNKTKEYRAEKTKQRLAKCWKAAAISKYRNILKEDDIKLIISKYNSTKHKAKSRKIEFDLDFDYYFNLIIKGCHYSGQNLLKEPGGTGLDRIDNSKGYIKHNVLPCIGWVNKMRMDNLTVEETKIAVNAVLDYRFKMDDLFKKGG